MAFERQTTWLRHFRLTIAKKLALAIIGIVILCVGTMAWVTSQNLQRGFISYLNQLQTEHLEQVAQAIEKRYRETGSFDWLRHNRREMRQLLDSVPAKLVSPQYEPPPAPPREERRAARRALRAAQDGGRQLADRPVYGPLPAGTGAADGRGTGPDDRPPGADERRPRLTADGRAADSRAADERPLGPDGRRPPLGTDGRPVDERTPGPDGRRPPLGTDGRAVDDRPFGPDGRRPPLGTDGRAVDDRPFGPDGRRPPPNSGGAAFEERAAGADTGAGLPPARASLPPAVASLPPPQEDLPPEGNDEGQGPRPPRDPMGFGGRLAIIDADGRSVIGPLSTPGAIERPLMAEGRRIGMLRLAPIEAVSSSSESSGALRFIQNQIRTILWLALVLLVLAILLATMLARHFLRPVSALREVTQQLAEGQFDARAPLIGQDELSELAHHVNDMAQALQDNEARRRKMLADISHELRTPLSVIRGEIEALQDGVRKSGPQALNSLHGEVLRLNKLIDDLHQLSLADSGDLRCQHQVFDLVPLLAGIGNRYLPRGAQANLGLKFQLPPTPVLINGDPDRLTQVFTNLLENSLRYTDAGGSIVVSVRTSHKRVQVLVEDSAPGVAPEVLPRLFERLYRTDAARTRTSGGSGLGLSICQALIQAHGGQISAHASPLGGVRMQIQLPLLQTALT